MKKSDCSIAKVTPNLPAKSEDVVTIPPNMAAEIETPVEQPVSVPVGKAK